MAPLTTRGPYLIYTKSINNYAKLDQNTQLDLLLSNHLLHGLQWTGEKNPLSTSALKNKATDYVVRDLEQGLQTRYLAVVKVATYEPVVAVDKKTFQGR